jgi:hypothetical protein
MKPIRRLGIFLILSLAITSRAAQPQPIDIGYANCLAVTNYSPSLMNQVTGFNWYFAHASVGELMLEGVTNLYLSNPSFYQLQSSPCNSNPPATTTAGVIYGDDRGHSSGNNYSGDWQYEVACFQTAVSNGWHYPLVNIAMNILSFVDIWYNNSSNGVNQLLAGYIGSMTNLEAAFPQTVFVYVTMPITTTNYYFEVDTEPADEYWRCVFNNGLRAWCQANNRVLFDLADVEAHDTNGNLQTFSYDGLLCEQLWSGDNQGGDACCGEIGDGAHPSNFGAEELIAKGFYALAAALSQTGQRPSLTTTLASSADPSLCGQTTMFSATVTASDGTPTGTVQFLTNGSPAGSPAVLTNGVASFGTGALPRGTNTIIAAYSGDSNFPGSTGAMAQVVLQWSGTVRFGGLSNGTALLNCAAMPNFGCAVQRSTNLRQGWVTLGTTNTPVGGSFQWVDGFHDLAAVPPSAFYRLRQN